MADLEDIEDAGHHDDETIFTNCRNNLLESFAIASKPQQSEDDHSILGRENMKIYLRIRPFSDKEIKDGENQHCLERENEHMVIMHAPKDSVTYKNSMHGCGKVAHKFTFSKTFPDMTSQKEFFNVTMLGKVKDFVDGQNCLLFTYGVTNSGKTYTIQGNPKDAGILPRTLDVLFNSIQGRQWEGMSLKPRMFSDIVKLSTRQEAAEQKVKDSVMKLATDDDIDVTSLLGDDAASDVSRLSTISTVSTATANSDDQPMITNEVEAKENIVKLFEEAENREREEAAISVEAQGQIKFSVWVSFAEVYNEYIYDLLEAIPTKKNEKNFRRTTLKLSEDKNGSPYIKGLKHIHVTSADEAYKVLTIGQKNLSVACTKLNHSSSRSHCIFNIKLLRVVDKDDPHVARISQLSFCDLAGSERYGKTKADGERLKEAGNINTSLLTLGRCLAVLRHNQAHPKDTKIIPFRDSKLTRLFQSYFSGKGKASMIVNINQCATMFDETLHVCKFSAIAKQIKVEQEVEKVRPKPRAKGITMALNQSSRVRPSIAWATPGTMAQYTEEAANIPLPEEDEDEDLDDDEEEDADNVQGNQKLIELLQSLKNQLVEEKRKNMNLEVEIRNEVCQEMADQLVEIENSYSDRLREEQMLIEEKAEKRIEMYTQSVKKSRKRARVVEDDEDEYVSSIHLHAEKVKVQEAEKHNSELQTQLSSVRADLSQTREQLQQAEDERKKAQDLVAELQSKLDNAQSASDSENTVTQVRKQIEVLETGKARQEKELTAAYEAIKDLKATLKEQSRGNQQEDESQISNNELIKNLTRELTEAKEQLQAQITENAELQETLNEAGETFQQKESEISKLQTVIAEGEKSIEEQASALTELQKLVEELRAGVEEAHEKISQKDTQIGTLEQQLAESKGRPIIQLKDAEQASTEQIMHNIDYKSTVKDSIDLFNRISESRKTKNDAMRQTSSVFQSTPKPSEQCEIVSQVSKHSSSGQTKTVSSSFGQSREVSDSSEQSKPVSLASDGQSRPISQSSDGQSSPICLSPDGQSNPISRSSDGQSKVISQSSDGQSRPISQSSDGQSRPISQSSGGQSRPISSSSDGQSRPICLPPDGQSNPISQSSDGQSRPISLSSDEESRPISQSSDGQSRPISQSSDSGMASALYSRLSSSGQTPELVGLKQQSISKQVSVISLPPVVQLNLSTSSPDVFQSGPVVIHNDSVRKTEIENLQSGAHNLPNILDDLPEYALVPSGQVYADQCIKTPPRLSLLLKDFNIPGLQFCDSPQPGTPKQPVFNFGTSKPSPLLSPKDVFKFRLETSIIPQTEKHYDNLKDVSSLTCDVTVNVSTLPSTSTPNKESTPNKVLQPSNVSLSNTQQRRIISLKKNINSNRGKPLGKRPVESHSKETGVRQTKASMLRMSQASTLQVKINGQKRQRRISPESPGRVIVTTTKKRKIVECPDSNVKPKTGTSSRPYNTRGRIKRRSLAKAFK